MKIAITMQGSAADSAPDQRFGRARCFRIVDSATGEQTCVDNAAGVDAAQGAGTQAVQTLARHGVQAVITGHVGPKAWTALQAAGIRAYSATQGTLAQLVEDFTAGRLAEIGAADRPGHW